VKADTNALHLSERGVNIWDGNGSREYLDSIGLQHRKVGDLGPVYGFQWRHFGAEYVDCDSDYTGQGIDQLAEVINKVKNSPYDRRIIMSAWNPSGSKTPKYLTDVRYEENGVATLSSPRSLLCSRRRSRSS
jgi:thymidylate synthase